MTRLCTLARALPPPALGEPLTDQAARWADHALATSSLPPAYLTRKALTAVAFSLRHGLRELAVPTKLVGVAAHQAAVHALAPYAALPVCDRPRLIVSHTGHVYARQPDRSLAPVGRVQPRHLPWLLPLLGHGTALHLHAVTGIDRRARGLPATLGLNVRLSLARVRCPAERGRRRAA